MKILRPRPLVAVLDETLAVVKKKKLLDTMGDEKAEALVNILDDAQVEVEVKRLGDTQLVEKLANTLEGMDNKTLSDELNKKLVHA